MDDLGVPPCMETPNGLVLGKVQGETIDIQIFPLNIGFPVQNFPQTNPLNE